MLHSLTHLYSVRLVSFVSIVSLSTKIVYTLLTNESLVILDRGGCIGVYDYFCGSLLSTQKRGIKKRLNRTKKSIEIKEVMELIRDRLDHRR